MLHELELEFINYIQLFRNPLFDYFFKFLDFFDRQEFFFILIPIIWLGKGWKTGLRLFYILFFSSFINQVLKEFFLSPRPFHIDVNVGIIQVGGLGFPSGAAQTVILLSGLLLISWKTPWKWVLASTYTLFVSFSRVYLGIHFPSDILGGWLIGFCLLAIFVYVLPPIERQLERLNSLSLFLLSQAIPMLVLTCQHSILILSISSIAMGMGLGLFIIHSYHLLLILPKTRKEFILRGLVGVLGTFAYYSMTLLLPTSNSIFYLFPKFLLLGLWVSLGSQLVCREIFRNNQALEASS